MQFCTFTYMQIKCIMARHVRSSVCLSAHLFSIDLNKFGGIIYGPGTQFQFQFSFFLRHLVVIPFLIATGSRFRSLPSPNFLLTNILQ